MLAKLIEFEDGGLFRIEKQEDGILITIQAKHLGKDFKITSSSAKLNKPEIKEIIKWLQEDING